MSMSSPVVNSGSSSSRSSSVSEEYEQRPALPNIGRKTPATDKDETSWTLGQATDNEEINISSNSASSSETDIASEQKSRENNYSFMKMMMELMIEQQTKKDDALANKWYITCRIINSSLITAVGITQFALAFTSLPDLSRKTYAGIRCHGDGVTSPCPLVTDIDMVDSFAPKPLAEIASEFTLISSFFLTLSGTALLIKACRDKAQI